MTPLPDLRRELFTDPALTLFDQLGIVGVHGHAAALEIRHVALAAVGPALRPAIQEGGVGGAHPENYLCHGILPLEAFISSAIV